MRKMNNLNPAIPHQLKSARITPSLCHAYFLHHSSLLHVTGRVEVYALTRSIRVYSNHRQMACGGYFL